MIDAPPYIRRLIMACRSVAAAAALVDDYDFSPADAVRRVRFIQAQIDAHKLAQ